MTYFGFYNGIEENYPECQTGVNRPLLLEWTTGRLQSYSYDHLVYYHQFVIMAFCDFLNSVLELSVVDLFFVCLLSNLLLRLCKELHDRKGLADALLPGDRHRSSSSWLNCVDKTRFSAT